MFYTKEGLLPLVIHGVFDFKYKVLYSKQEFWFQAHGFTIFFTIEICNYFLSNATTFRVMWLLLNCMWQKVIMLYKK